MEKNEIREAQKRIELLVDKIKKNLKDKKKNTNLTSNNNNENDNEENTGTSC